MNWRRRGAGFVTDLKKINLRYLAFRLVSKENPRSGGEADLEGFAALSLRRLL